MKRISQIVAAVCILTLPVVAQNAANTVVILKLMTETEERLYLVQPDGYSESAEDVLLARGVESGTVWTFNATLAGACLASIRSDTRTLYANMYLLPGDTLIINNHGDNITMQGGGGKWANLQRNNAPLCSPYDASREPPARYDLLTAYLDSCMSVGMARIDAQLDRAGAPESFRKLMHAPYYAQWAMPRLDYMITHTYTDELRSLPPLSVMLHFMKKIPDSMFEAPYARLMEPLCKRLLDLHFAEARYRLSLDADKQLVESVIDNVRNYYPQHLRCCLFRALASGLKKERPGEFESLIKAVEECE